MVSNPRLPSAAIDGRASAVLRASAPRRRRALRSLVCACAIALSAGAAPAGALVTPVLSPQFGVEPHSTTPFTAAPTLPLTYHGGPVMHSNKTYAIYWDASQNPVNQYDGDWKSLINRYLYDVGAESGSLGNVYAVASQYTDTSGGRAAYRSGFLGAFTDKTAYPSGGCSDPHPTGESIACLTDAQLRAELTSFIAANHLPTGLGTIYFLLTPPGVTICTDGGTVSGHCSDSKPGSTESFEHSFCSYHSFIGSGAATILYAAQPWTAGTLGGSDVLARHGEVDCQNGKEAQQEPNQLLGVDTDGDFDSGLPDVIINEISVEQLAIETDPLLNGWYAPAGQANAGNEMPDQCRNWFEPKLGGSPSANTSEQNDSEAGTLYNQSINGDHYYVNTEYDQAALAEDYPGVACIPGVSLVPQFTAPNSVNSGEVVGFDASESNISLGAASYTWNFGDGSAPASSGSSVFHSYTYGGTYDVTLTITDSGGNTASAMNTVTVVGPAPPSSGASSAGTGAGASGAASGASTNSSSNAGQGSHSTAAKPGVTASVASRSLRTALRSGVLVRYSVSERVTGRFELLLASSTARRIGVHGSQATGLAKGTPPQTIIGKALLVTTAGGRNTIKIQFSAATSARLRRLRNVPLMLRLVVRNAAAANSTVLTTITLTG